jgi:amphi-Trp domain-containing protein
MAKKRDLERFSFATRLTAADAARVASHLASGLSGGEVTLQAEEQSLVLRPGDDLSLRLDAREEHDPQGAAEGRIRITLRYRRLPPS